MTIFRKRNGECVEAARNKIQVYEIRSYLPTLPRPKPLEYNRTKHSALDRQKRIQKASIGAKWYSIMWMFELGVMFTMICLNSVFAAYEISLASIGEGRLHALVAEKKRGAESAARMKESIEASLAVIQLGITLVGVVAAATGGAGAEESVEPILLSWGVPESLSQFLSIAIVVIPLTFATIILGELAPKVFALRNKEFVCLTLSPIMEWFSYSVWPIVWFLEHSVSWLMRLGGGRNDDEGNRSAIHELLGAAAFARISQLIGKREEAIIVSASRLSSTPVRKICLPSEHIDMLSIENTLADALVAAHLNMHTRYPVTEEAGNPQRITGYVNFKDIVSSLRYAPRNSSFRNLVRSLGTFAADSPVSECLERLMRDRSHIALVKEANGTVIGLVTLEDIIEELVGEIHDEFDRIPSHLIQAGEGWIAGGFVPLHQLRTDAGIDLQQIGEKPLYTLNDWVVESLGRPPRGGDIINTESCTVVVRKTRNVLLSEAFVSRAKPENG